ncbi:MAG: uracil-DNA glycosylase [Bacteroidales bacterium]|nr:uracil-DNA glycosylase [Bacteroidales bacterium]
MTRKEPVIEESWKQLLYKEFQSEYFRQLKEFLVLEKKKYVIFPPGPDIFAAFNHTPYHKVKAVILGQDPYHGTGQANGLCFSVRKDIPIPPSLMNIYKELKNDTGLPLPGNGDLQKWAVEGVLLLNAILTVRANQPGSHRNRGWENFTDAVIKQLSEKKEKLVFILWGNFAQAKAGLINPSKHFILKSPHPSPFSADRGFFGSRPFTKTNMFLDSAGIGKINWEL